MQVLRVRFTLGRMMVLVALIALNLAAAVSTSSYYPRPTPLPVPILVANGRGYVHYRVEGEVEYGVGNGETGYRRTWVDWSRRRPTLPRIWSPVVASVGASLLILVLSTGRRARAVGRIVRRERRTVILIPAFSAARREGDSDGPT